MPSKETGPGYWDVPQPDDFLPVGATQLRAMATGEWTPRTIYDSAETADSKVRGMAWELLQLRSINAKLAKRIKELQQELDKMGESRD